MKWNKKEYNKFYYLKNKECMNKQMHEYRLKNKEQTKLYNKFYYQKNKECINKRYREYRLKNKEYTKERNREYFLNNSEHIKEYRRIKYQTDPNFRLGSICRSRINIALKYNHKSASTMKLIGCTIDELRRHIESKFESWMTWANQGLWHLDHIKACANFDLTDPEQQRACFNWSNLQPLWASDNMSKGAR